MSSKDGDNGRQEPVILGVAEITDCP